MVTFITQRLSSTTQFRLRQVSVIFAGCMIQLSFGSLAYSFGNMNPYVTSYMRHSGADASLTYTECTWAYVMSLVGQSITMNIAEILVRKIGSKWTCLLGCWTFSFGIAMSYFTIQHSFGALVITYGIISGSGCGIAYMVPLAIAMKWMPENPGLANGIVNGGAGGGALIFTLIQTSFINPTNERADLEKDGERYFDQDDMLERVPSVFILLGGVYAAMQFLSVLLLAEPPMKEFTAEISARSEANGQRSSLALSENDPRKPLLPKTQGELFTPRSEEEEDKEKEEEENLTPRQVLKTLDFYLLFFIFMFNGLGIVFLNSLYKAYGLSFINDDVFLSAVGSLSSVFNFLGRIFWGVVADRFSFRIATMLMCTVFTSLILTLQVTQLLGNKYLFMVYICLLIATGSGTFTLLPTATAKRFGNKHVTTNYGMIFASEIVTAPLTAILSQSLLTRLGWNGLFFVIGGCYYCGFILTFIFRAKDKHGKYI